MSPVQPNPQSPQYSPPPPPIPGTTPQADATGGIIPYKNPHALAAYYLGVFSVIPFLGLLCACAAVPLGISGLKKKKANPIIRGTAHAWIGIIVGSLSILVHVVLIALPFVATLTSRR